ncbi:MAG: isocitrate lyase/phosphoenolpyruvate mutase family protein [Vicinamibacterales bacterium]
MDPLEQQTATVREWMDRKRFQAITRLHSARDVAEQQGSIPVEYGVARDAAEAFYLRLRELFSQKKSITTFGPYSTGQIVAMKRMGIEGIYLGGWATSAKGSMHEDPGPDLASYPLSQVPDEAASLVRALLTADKNQHFARSRMTDEKRKATPVVDFRPFLIADADTGHGGESHVRNLIRRFVEVGVPGYHIEDQRPGAKKCGHQAGKVLVASDEQIKRLNAARFQLDIMKVAGIIVARTDAEAATLLESSGSEYDQPFMLGATNTDVPSYRAAFSAILKRLADLGVTAATGHLLFGISEVEYKAAYDWLGKVGLLKLVEETAAEVKKGALAPEKAIDKVDEQFGDLWQEAAQMKTMAQAVADELASSIADGQKFDMTVEEWNAFARLASHFEIRHKARQLGVQFTWDAELSKTPDGFYHVQGGIPYAISKSLAAAPFADLIWMETKTANLEEAKMFADAIHAKFPDQMLAYNLSPSFNWDTTGMSDDEMRAFPEELGKLGFVFNFITYGGHQIDGMASEEFATALRQDGMLALARLQRRLRLLDSPYQTPQALVGGNRLDAALMATSGRTAATKAMGKGSTHHQHLIQIEVPLSTLGSWLEVWRGAVGHKEALKVEMKPYTAGSDVLRLKVNSPSLGTVATVIFTAIQDRRGRTIIEVRDQNTIQALRKQRLMTVVHLFLIHRFKAASMHFVSPTEDNAAQIEKMTKFGIFEKSTSEVGQIIVAEVNKERVHELLKAEALSHLIKEGAAVEK